MNYYVMNILHDSFIELCIFKNHVLKECDSYLHKIQDMEGTKKNVKATKFCLFLILMSILCFFFNLHSVYMGLN